VGNGNFPLELFFFLHRRRVRIQLSCFYLQQKPKKRTSICSKNAKTTFFSKIFCCKFSFYLQLAANEIFRVFLVFAANGSKFSFYLQQKHKNRLQIFLFFFAEALYGLK